MQAIVNGCYFALTFMALGASMLIAWTFCKAPPWRVGWTERNRLLVGIFLVATGAWVATLLTIMHIVNAPIYIVALQMIVVGYIFHIRTVTRATIGAWFTWAAIGGGALAWICGALLVVS